MAKIYRNETAEYIKQEGWEMTGSPVSLDMHPDLVREPDLVKLLGKHRAYAQYGIEFDGQKKTLAYALKPWECCGKCD